MIRAGRPADAAAMGAILSDWIDATPWMPRLHTRDEDAGFCAGLIARARVLILELAGGVSGFLARDGAEIPAFYLAAPARGRGHGAALLGAAKAQSGGRLGLWTFQANDAAIRFYLRHGFRETARTDGQDNDEHLPDIRLDWSAS